MLSVSIIGFYIAAEPRDCNQDQSLAVPGNLETPGWKKPPSLPWRPAACMPRAGRGGLEPLPASREKAAQSFHTLAFRRDALHGFHGHSSPKKGETQPLREPKD